MKSFRELWPHFSTYKNFISFIADEYRIFKVETGAKEPVPTQFLEAFNKKMDIAFKDYSELTFDQIFFTGDVATIKPRLYFGRLQLKYLKNQVTDFEEKLWEAYQDLNNLSVENITVLNMEHEGLSYEEAKKQAELEVEPEIKTYNFYNQIAEPFLESFSKRVNEYYYYFDNDCRSLMPDFDDRDLMGEETIKKMAAVFLDYSDVEVENLLNKSINKVSDDLNNINPASPLTGTQLGILSYFFIKTGLFTSKNKKEIAESLNVITGVSKQKVREALGILIEKNKAAGQELLTTYKEGEPKHDSWEVIRYLSTIVKKIKDEIGE